MPDSIIMIHLGLCGVYYSDMACLNVTEFCTCSQKIKNKGILLKSMNGTE